MWFQPCLMEVRIATRCCGAPPRMEHSLTTVLCGCSRRGERHSELHRILRTKKETWRCNKSLPDAASGRRDLGRAHRRNSAKALYSMVCLQKRRARPIRRPLGHLKFFSSCQSSCSLMAAPSALSWDKFMYWANAIAFRTLSEPTLAYSSVRVCER